MSTVPSLFFTRPEVAQILRASQRTVDEWIRSGVIPSVRLGGRVLVSRSELLRLAEVSNKPKG